MNPTLKAVYENDDSEIGDEITAFSGMVESSLSMYGDAAVIVFSREGGEGSDAPTTVAANGRVELARPGEHLALPVDAEGNEIKHSLMLTDSEEQLVDYVKARFSNIILVLNTSNAMEVGALQNDDGISAIIDIGRPGVGEYKLFITYTIDGYIQKTGSYTLNVVSAFRMNEEGDALDAAKVGKDFIAEILSDVFTTKDGKYTAVTYSVKEGALPAGLTLSPDGIIEGKPEAAGTYDFVVLMTAEEPSSSPAASSGNVAPTLTTLDYPMTIVVGE